MITISLAGINSDIVDKNQKRIYYQGQLLRKKKLFEDIGIIIQELSTNEQISCKFVEVRVKLMDYKEGM